jgi:hypothetical protein
MKKNYKISKHTNKLHKPHQNTKKNNILKISLKKWVVLLTLCGES